MCLRHLLGAKADAPKRVCGCGIRKVAFADGSTGNRCCAEGGEAGPGKHGAVAEEGSFGNFLA